MATLGCIDWHSLMRRSLGRHALSALLTVALISACAPVTKTQVYEANINSDIRTLSILPFEDRTSGGGLGDENLTRMQEELASELEDAAAYEAIALADDTIETQNDAVVRNSITLFDLSSRRVVVKTEVISPDNDRVLAKFVTRSEIVSIIWPIDYIGALQQSSGAIVRQIAASLSESRGEGA